MRVGSLVRPIGAAAVLLLITAGLAFAQAAQPETAELHACAHDTTGALRLVDGPQTCRPNESAVVWNVVGPTGPQGPKGEPGQTGPQGPQGEPGDGTQALAISCPGGTYLTGIRADGSGVCIDPDDPDSDGDSQPDSIDCADQDPSVFPGQQEVTNGVDDDCDGQVDETGDADDDGDGYLVGADCDDTVATTYPGAPEYDNDVDDDCDGQVDDGVLFRACTDDAAEDDDTGNTGTVLGLIQASSTPVTVAEGMICSDPAGPERDYFFLPIDLAPIRDAACPTTSGYYSYLTTITVIPDTLDGSSPQVRIVAGRVQDDGTSVWTNSGLATCGATSTTTTRDFGVTGVAPQSQDGYRVTASTVRY